MRLIDADILKEAFIVNTDRKGYLVVDPEVIIDNAPTVDIKDIYQEGHYDGHLEGYTKAINEERPQGICKTCKYYYPYYKQFSSEPRGDGYCGIQRMTPEGIIHINCNDEFGCLDYQKGGAE